MTISIQRWLSVRLDMFGNILILGIALFAAGYRNTVAPSKIGVVLTYTLNSKFLTCQLKTAVSNNFLLVTQIFCKSPLVDPLLRNSW